MGKILGLDLGTNSIGWSLIDSEHYSIIDMGVRIFEEGVNNMNTSKEESKNAKRRTARQIRKLNRRRKFRKLLLFKKLVELNMAPAKNIEPFIEINPYKARRDAVNKQITLMELGRALFHICQRRGYKSNRKESIDDKEKGKIFEGDAKAEKAGISELKIEMLNGNYKTIGEYLFSLNPHEKRIRNRYTERKMYFDEFNAIWDFQQKYYPDLLTEENRVIIRDRIIFYQKPLKSQKQTIGKCIFEKNKRRCPKSHPVFQEFRMLQQVNSIRISGVKRITEEQTMLSMEERDVLIKYLSENKELSYKIDKKSIFKVLKLDLNKFYRFNLKDQGKIDGLKTIHALKSALGKDYSNFDENEILKMWNTLHFAEDDEWLRDYAQKTWNFTQEQAQKFAKIKLEPDYANLSLKAITKMLPFMRDGLMYHLAAQSAGYHHSLAEDVIEKTEYLPEPPGIANPIVTVALHQLRKVVNSLIDYYGSPDAIRVELARDMKNSRNDRLEMLRSNKERETINKKISDKLINDNIIESPKRNDIIKYRLWEECNHICPYTGKSISLHQLFVTGEVDVEHILPYSRTLDDSYNNKTLCFRSENELKGNRTPYEAYSSDESKYNGILDRVKEFSHSKARRFKLKNLDALDDFIERQLNDTRYISREAKKYLAHICDKVNVSSGQSTAILRHYWGLNSILKESQNPYLKDKEDDAKSRDDHRHHAIDATVIALTTQSFIQMLSTHHRKYGTLEDKNIEKFPFPWENFRSDVLNKIDNILISHKANKRVRGQLHEETIYGKLLNQDGTQRMNEGGIPVYAIRKPLESLTGKQVKGIIDPVVKNLVFERLRSLGVNTDEEKFDVPRNSFNEPLYMVNKTGLKIRIKSVRVAMPSAAMKNIRGYNAWVETGGNHHIVLFSDESGKIDGRVVSLFDAVLRKRDGLPVIDRELEPGLEFICSLHRNEMVIAGDLPEDFDYLDKSTYHLVFKQVFRVQKMVFDKRLMFRLHFVTYNRDLDNRGVLRRGPATIGKFSKLLINPIGYLEFCND